jgi:4-hydroxyisophthalate hydroxylase
MQRTRRQFAHNLERNTLRKYQVVIVGGGPVGVALAVELGLRGVSCALIERRTELSRIPKGQGLQQRSMEHFHFWGIAHNLREARVMPKGFPIGNVTAYRSLMTDIWDAPPGREVVNPYYFTDRERLPQYCTERVLRERMQTIKSVDDYFGWQAIRIDQTCDNVRVLITREGIDVMLEAAYVVGCDGGHSLVREQSNIDRHGSDFNEIMALVVFRSEPFHRALDRFPPRSTFRVLDPELKGYWKFFGRVDVGETFFFHAPIRGAGEPEDIDVAKLLYGAAGFEFPVKVEHIGLWDLRVEVANGYRAGRVLIAGDAAHTHPPYGGYGLNNGLEDVVNLGWKLASVLQGWGGDGILDSYSIERQTVFREVGEDIIAAGIRFEREFLERHMPESEGDAFPGLFKTLTQQAARRVRDYEPHYSGSPVVVGPPGSVISAHGEHVFAVQAGHHLAPSVLSSGINVYQELGPWFTLLAFGAVDSDVLAFERIAKELRIPMTVIRDSSSGDRKRYEARMVLVRPDQFVAWVGDRAPNDVEAVLRKIVARMS